MDVFEVEQQRLPIAGGKETFPVRRIYCVGRNYGDHVREMGGEPERTPPVFFLKAVGTLAIGGGDVAYPPRTENLHYEMELVAALHRGGRDIPAAEALDHVYGYAVGIDLTRRDHQAKAKENGAPWDTAKSFEHAAPISALHTAAEIGHPREGRIWLSVNDEIRQDADLAEMIWSVSEAIADLSTLYTLAPGDLLFTGTPAGVGAVSHGDVLRGGVAGVDEIEITIT